MRRVAALLPLAVALACAALPAARAQGGPQPPQPPRPPGPPAPGGEGQEPEPEREALSLGVDEDVEATLARVDDLAARGQWDRVVEVLDKLLLEGGATLAPGERPESARSIARRRLEALPPDGRAAYGVVHDDAAQRLLEQGQRGLSPRALLDVLRLHPASKSAPRARALLAARLLEAGRAGEALEHLDALLAAPDLAGEARERLAVARVDALAQAGRPGEAALACDRLRPGPAAEAVRARLDALARAVAAPAPARPGALAWRSETVGYYEPAPPSAWSLPATDGARAYVHDGSHVVAVDLLTGRLDWRAALRPEDAFTPPEGACALALAPDVVVAALPGGEQPRAAGEEQGNPAGPALPPAGGPAAAPAPKPPVGPAPRRAGPGGLVGVDRATGEVRWRRTLAQVKDAADVDFHATLGGVAACGPVVVVALVLDQPRPEVHAVAFDAATGERAWSALLASRDEGRPPRVALVAADGRLVVSTGLGAIVALDPTGEVRWARRYRSQRDPKNRPRRGGGIPGMPRLPGLGGGEGEGQGQGPPERAPGLVAARGLVWAAPADALELVCWELGTGELVTELKAPEVGRLVAARGPGVLVLSKEGDVYEATRQGATLVTQLGGAPAGEGAVAGDHLYLPRADGLVDVDLTGKRVALATTWERTRSPGNVAVAAGRVVIACPRGLFGTGAEPQPTRALIQSELARALGDPGYATREEAQAQLAKLGEEARPRLEALLRSSDVEARVRATVLLGELDRVERIARWRPLVKPTWAEAVPDALNRLTHMNAEVRLDALRELGAVEDPDVVALLKDLLQDREERVGWAAAVALMLKKDRSGAEHLARAVKDGLPQDQLSAVDAIGRFGGPQDLDALTPGLASVDDDVRAATVLASLRVGGRAALPRVRGMIQDPAPAVRLAFIEGLGDAGDDECLRLLTAMVTDEDDMVRSVVVHVLAEHWTSPEAMRGLAIAIGDDTPAVALLAAAQVNKSFQAFRGLPQDEAERRKLALAQSLPAASLERALASKDAQTRDNAAQLALRFADAGGLLSVPSLAAMLSDPEVQIRGWKLGGKGWMAFILERATATGLSAADVAAVGSLSVHEEAGIRVKGFQILATIAGAPGAGHLLIPALDDADERIRTYAENDLKQPGTRDGALSDPLAVEEALRIEALSSRAEGKRLAGRLLDQAPRAKLVPGLLRVLRACGPALQAAATKRLAGLAAGAPGVDAAEPAARLRALSAWWWRESHPGEDPVALVRALGDENPSERWRAAQALAGLPTPAVRNALASGLAQEPLEWVLRARVKALVGVLGEAQGYVEGCPEADLRACARRLQVRVAQQIQEEAAPR